MILRAVQDRFFHCRRWLLRLTPGLSGLLVGCGLLSSTPPSLPELPLLAPSELQQHWQVTQTVTLQPLPTSSDPQTSPGRPPLLAVWSVTDERLDLAGLTLSGQTLLTLTYQARQGQAGQLSEQSTDLLPAGVSGRDILSQIQLAYWPLSALQNALRTSPWQLREIPGADNRQQRQLYLPSLGQPWDNSQPVLSIAHWPNAGQQPGKVTIIHHLQHWQLDIDTLSIENLAPASEKLSPPSTFETTRPNSDL